MAEKQSKWDVRIERAEKFFKKALSHGQEVYRRYQDEREDITAFEGFRKANLFYSNVATLKQSLFNSMPAVDVSRLHKGDFDDDVARVASLMLQRAVTYEVNRSASFTEAVERAILDRLVPGLGVCWLSFGVELDEPGDTEGQDSDNPAPPPALPIPGSEHIRIENVYWEDFIYEPARCWSDVTWAGRRLNLTRDECEKRWGPEKVSLLSSVKNDSGITPKEITDNKFLVYEIWDKSTKTVSYIAKGAPEPLETIPDPLGLRDFWPFPAPLIANPTTTAFLPVTDYYIAQDQYTQLDILYARMALIIDAVKVAGVYASDQSSAIEGMLKRGENKLVPVDNWAVFAENGGVKGIIDWYPLDMVVSVLQQLQQQFDAIKAVLYEITGMSDIIRGASNQYETASAQEIKAQFASVRMNGYQRDVSAFVGEILSIIAEMVVSLYSDEKLAAIVGPLNEADLPLAQPALALLRDKFLATARVSVKADSLVQADWALEKTQRMELMGYLAQFLNSSMPMMQQNPFMGQLLLSMMKWTVTGFRGSQEIEGVIDQQLSLMQQAEQQAKANPQPPPPSPEQIKAQADAEYQQREMAMAEQRHQFEMQRQAAEAAAKERESQLQYMLLQQKAQFDAMLKQQEQQHKERLFVMEEQRREMELYVRTQLERVKLRSAERQAEIKAEAAEESMEGPESEGSEED